MMVEEKSIFEKLKNIFSLNISNIKVKLQDLYKLEFV